MGRSTFLSLSFIPVNYIYVTSEPSRLWTERLPGRGFRT